LLNINTCIEAAKVVNIVMYIPVADATTGSVPIITSIDTKIFPGLIPQKAAISDPKNETPTNIPMLDLVAYRSPDVKL